MDTMNELTKEVFAQFGLAYYHSEALHRGLCNLYATMTFERGEDITRPRFEEKIAHAFSLTLGQMIEETKKLLPSQLHQRLEISLEKRNFLAHHFWYDRIHLMFSEQGLHDMIQELRELREMFSNLDNDIDHYFKPKREALGFGNELLERELNKLAAGELEEPLISQRLPKKQERIVRVWDAKVSDNGITQIFESDDGCLWQLCDVGLGWTLFTKPDATWTINEILQKYFPANINPRPPSSTPWNYEIALGKGAVLSVKRGKSERSYTWSVRTPLKEKSVHPNQKSQIENQK